MKPRVIVADDNTDFLSVVVSTLQCTFDVVGTASDGHAAFHLICDSRPNVAILDIAMPGLNGIQVTEKTKERRIGTAVVICSIETDPGLIQAAREAGALAYVFKTRIKQDLVSAVRAAYQGHAFVSPL